MSESIVFMLDPTAEGQTSNAGLADRPDDLRGLTVGLVDNGWWSLGVVLERYRHLLAERFGITDVIHYKKKLSSPSPSEAIDDLAAKCQVVIAGLGN
ncbi:MAG: hypothetical protein Q7O66_14125 [Dehalococcoidia bacterium]|nr:hypothetical protein [Dehalococcoidia bacterium]